MPQPDVKATCLCVPCQLSKQTALTRNTPGPFNTGSASTEGLGSQLARWIGWGLCGMRTISVPQTMLRKEG